MKHLYILIFVLSVVLLLGYIEYYIHRKNLSKLKFRIHVNGTRGKSSVTRLIAAGFREAGFATCAKTTGTLPRVIFPDGSEYPVHRNTRANIIEQIRIVKAAIASNAEVLVIECMALQPLLQKVSQDKLVQATHVVITNVRADHLDVMGPKEEDIAKSFCATIPPNGTVFTAERKYTPILEYGCNDRNARLVTVSEAEVESITDDTMKKFEYIEHKENVALALKICKDFGIEEEIALRGICSAKPDPGALMSFQLNFFGKNFYFVNAFAANDPESTERIWRKVLSKYNVQQKIALFNCRADRTDRTIQLAEAYIQWPEADQIILMGTGTFIFAKRAVKLGVSSSKFTFTEDNSVEQIFESILEKINGLAVIVGMGNIGGKGLELIRYFENRSIRKEGL